MLRFICLFLLFAPSALNAQSLIEVAETTLKVGGLGSEEFYYGFAEGDQLVFNFQEVNGKDLKEIEITELPSSSKFMDYKTSHVSDKTITVRRTGIYKFRLANSSLGGRVCKVKIQRIPASDSMVNFNTSVQWRTVKDTIYFPKLEKYLVSSDTVVKNVYSVVPQISSTNALNGNRNWQIVDFVIPDNTVSWSFYIGTGNKGKLEYDNARDEYMKSTRSSLSKIPEYGPLAALALTGVSYFNKVQGEDNVKYWFLTDENSVALFRSGQKFSQYKQGDVINEASQMQSPLKGKAYLALLNDNTIDPIAVTLEVVAVQVFEKWGTRTVQVMNIRDREEPYLQN